MALVLTEDQQMLRDAVRRFAAERAPVAQLRKLRDDGDPTGFSREVWGEMAAMGWAGVLVPEAHGGAGFGYVGAGLIAEEMGRQLSATPLLSTVVLGVSALVKAGSAAQKESLLPAIAAGEMIVALASDERSRHAPHCIATRASGGGGRFKITGRKVHVPPFLPSGGVTTLCHPGFGPLPVFPEPVQRANPAAGAPQFSQTPKIRQSFAGCLSFRAAAR